MNTPTLALAHCKSCKTAIFWLTGPSGRPAPITALPVPKGNILIDPETETYRVIPEGERAAYGATLRRNHFADCPDAQGKWRRGSNAPPPTTRNPQPREEHTPPMAGRGLNKVMIIGNLGRDPEMKYTQNGKAVTTFTVAVGGWNGSEGTTEWFSVVAWDKLAETCNQYLHKGSKVYIEGRLQTRSWDGQDGAKHYKTEIVAGQMMMLDGKPAGAGRPAAADADDDDDELPF